MTAEIVVMNTGGIALAADSAVTVGDRKVYHSADKLFRLSENHTVGVMIYGSTSIFHIPWETLIKVYRNKVDTNAFDTVQEYMDDFLQFLTMNEYDQFMSEANEDRYIKSALYANATALNEELSHMHQRLYNKYDELKTQSEIQEMYLHHAEEFLHNTMHQLEEKAFPYGFNTSDYELLHEKYAKIVGELIHRECENHLINHEWIEMIRYLIIQTFVKKFSSKYSGIIFAGFGDKELYPSIHLLIIDGKINNKIKYFTRKRTINNSTHAVIMPFAQRDMINNFLYGIHEDVEAYLSTFLKDECHLLSDTLIHTLKDNFKDEMNMELVEEEVSNTLTQVYETYRKKLYNYKRENFFYPTLDVVESLPTKELAHMAESLLHIASLKRKISFSMETVSNPIDVAILTKGDGFTWMKKK